MTACCPFHNEKTPSFYVSPSKGIFKCFGCGKAGDAITFVMEMEGIAYPEAIRYLAKKYNIEIEEAESVGREQQEEQNTRESLYIALHYAKDYFSKILLNSDEGRSVGLSYFRERGFSDPVIRSFELGYALESWDAFAKDAVKHAFNPEVLEKSGLISRKDDKMFDRFRGRVIFPIHNLSGRVVAFGARILKNDKKEAKYLNSPETDVYHKSKILYGLFQAKQAIRRENNCYLTEGYTDVITLHQAGIENTVASSGTSLTQEQAVLIKRFTDNVTLLYDGDEAGIKASLRGTDILLEEDLNVRVVLFPDGEDPDGFMRKVGTTAFQDYLKGHTKDFITFKVELLARDIQNDPFKKAEAIREAVESIAKIPDSVKRAVFFKQCGKLLDIEEGTLILEHNKLILNRKKKNPVEQTIEPVLLNTNSFEQSSMPSDRGDSEEREVVRLLLIYADRDLDDGRKFCDYLLEQTEDIVFESPLYADILNTVRKEHTQGRIINHEFFFQTSDRTLASAVAEMVTDPHQLSDHWDKFKIFVAREDEVLHDIAFHTVLRLKWKKLKVMMKENTELMQKADNPEEILRLQKVHMALKNTERELAILLGNVVSK